jgi:hypothetical protein
MKQPDYVVVETFSRRAYAQAFCDKLNVSYLDVIFNHGGEGLEARAYEDHALQGITEDQKNALIIHLTRHIA